MPQRFFDRRLHVVMGKGGVGRSTVSAAIAVAAASSGRRVLVCELKTAERMSRIFAAAPVGTEIAPVDEGVYAVNMTPQSALREVGLMKLRLPSLYRLTFENRIVAAFLRGIPGLPELLMMGKCSYHVHELAPEGDRRPRWDMVVVDAPATGHGIPFLRIPRVVLDLFGSSPLVREARSIQKLLQDPDRTALHLVTLPEELPTTEVLELRSQIEDQLGLPLGFLFVNQVLLPLLDTQQVADLDYLRKRLPQSADLRLRSLLDMGHAWCRHIEQQRPYLDLLLSQEGLSCIMLPRLFVLDFGRHAVHRLARHLGLRVDELEGRT